MFENEDDLLGGVSINDDDEGEDGEGETLFGEDMVDRDLLDEVDSEVLSEGERRAAESSMRKRDREEGMGEGGKHN